MKAPWWSRVWAGACVLAVAVAGGFFLVHVPGIAHYIVHLTGQDNEAGGHYGAWSGFWGAIQPTLIATGVIVYWHMSCHDGGCWLPGRYAAAGGTFRTCRWHHPDLAGRKPDHKLIRELHATWQRNAGGGR